LLWHEAQSFYGRGPNERIFITRLGDDGKTTVQFGDGVTGARLPTGQENVRATYRKGIGRGGLVKAEQISLLLTRPLGVKSAGGVTNPLDSAGADDAETLEDVRRNAPLTVLTLDRIVSLQDYEDFARAYAGIAKALATWTWNGQSRGVFVTVAGPDGDEVKADSDLYKNLLDAMRLAGDPHVSLHVQSYAKALFRLAARVKPHPDHLPEKVLAAVEKTLRERFAFDERQFGQPVALSEVVAVMQSAPGVVAVDVDKLYRFDDTEAGLNALLPAASPQADDKGTLAPAELLTLDPSSLHDLGVMVKENGDL
ncbi:MAG TPA: putative baseplate assembly protein, partial [Pyrinomonadaceae bacterium]|nr:putative baseplate assembly protein [Pyrinomonadaceae bacterium]